MLWSWLYQTLWIMAPPLLRRYLKKRAQLAPAYADYWPERFGQTYAHPLQHAIWIHAVSVGETRAAEPIIQALRRHFPEASLLITQTTPTGRDTAQKQYPDAQCRYLPYDKKAYVTRFLREHQPLFGVLMETEIWPNLLHQAAQLSIPMYMANARLSPKSQQGYLKVKGLVAPALATLQGCFAQTQADAIRLTSIGVPHIQVCGSSKYDITPPAPMRSLANQFRARIGQRPVVVCASTRVLHNKDEAAMLLRAWQAYTGNALLVIIPRHPERFQAAFDEAHQLGYVVQKRSDNQTIAPSTQIWVGDSLGELFAYYYCADVAFVGGSLVDTGCQNLIEPIACGVPTLFGPSTYNFAATAANAQTAGAAKQVANAEEWFSLTTQLLSHPSERQAMAAEAAHFIQQHQGASERMATSIADQHDLVSGHLSDKSG